MSLAGRFDSRQNSLNFLRLVFATLVIVSHSSPLTGRGTDPQFLRVTLGSWAVAGFFAISGYLIAISRTHTSAAGFLSRRVLRIFPAYLICLIVTAVIFAPLAAWIGPGRVRAGSSASYVGRNFYLVMTQYDIRATLDQVPYARTWDGSLWTLRYEFLCYLLVGLLLTITRTRRSLTLVAFVGVAGTAVYNQHEHHPGVLTNFCVLGATFLGGALFAVFPDRVPLTWRLAVPAAVWMLASAQVGKLNTLGALPLVYVCLWLGHTLPFDRVGRRNDISYGIYIYGFPVQQLLILLHAKDIPQWMYVIVAIVTTVPFAAASWFLVEKPCLRLVKPVDRRIGQVAALGSMLVHRRARSSSSTGDEPARAPAEAEPESS